jgi:glycosyltransferase involved in cell wall biosynthesis
MRIAVDARGAENPSGIAVATGSLLRGLTELASGHQFLIIGNAVPDRLPPNCEALITKHRLTDHPWGDIWFHFTLPGLLERWGAEVFWGPGFLVPITGRGFRKVVTFHDLSFEKKISSFPFATRIYFQTLFRRSAVRADKIIAVSDFTKNEIGKYYGRPCEEKTKVILNGYDPHFDKPVLEERARAARALHPYPYILAVGNLEPRKNLSRLIEAFQILKQEENIPHRLVLIGQKAWLFKSIFDDARATGLEDQIIFTGYISNSELAERYQAADLFVFPSLYEGFGLPVLEAMASGIPVVASNLASIPEIAGDAARFIDPLDARQMASTILEVIRSPELRRKLAEMGRRRCRDFSWGRSAEALLRELTECG